MEKIHQIMISNDNSSQHTNTALYMAMKSDIPKNFHGIAIEIQGVYISCTPYHEETGADSQSCHQGLAILEEYQTFQKDKRQYIR